jgi:cell division protein FtsI (penicillin-binding protein 3)
MNKKRTPCLQRGRRHIVLLSLFASLLLLVGRAVDLQVLRKDFLQDQGDARYLRVVQVAANRGMITDRNGEPLAISTPVDSVWANPRDAAAAPPRQLVQVARLLDMDVDYLRQRLDDHSGREFVYIKRDVNPDTARRVMELGVPGVSLQREYRRYYPAGEVAAHVIGFTNVDDVGQEGMELTYDRWLRGTPGSKRVIKDRLGRIVEDVESITKPVPGHSLALSIDRRVQYLAYRELKAGVQHYRARSGSAVILDAATGEVLAMVNQPSYNPNSRGDLEQTSHMRNRAVTDVFEPGSTIKAFTIAAALESGGYTPHTLVDTTPGIFRVGHDTIHDARNFGLIDVSTVIQKSSNVGASKIALSMEPKTLWGMFSRVGFGRATGSGFPGEVDGHLSDYWHWNAVEQATMSFGYGISVTPLQLARAYTIFADGGALMPVSFVRVDRPPPGTPLIHPETARQVRAMLESVVSEGGTGTEAHIPGYRVAGKTGTVHKPADGGYAEDRYMAIFVGMVPASHPRLVGVVVVNEPSGDAYYGGQVAAPIFARIMSGAVRLLDIPPDDLPGAPAPTPTPGQMQADRGDGTASAFDEQGHLLRTGLKATPVEEF